MDIVLLALLLAGFLFVLAVGGVIADTAERRDARRRNPQRRRTDR